VSAGLAAATLHALVGPSLAGPALAGTEDLGEPAGSVSAGTGRTSTTTAEQALLDVTVVYTERTLHHCLLVQMGCRP
jgi:hypothetical protein